MANLTMLQSITTDGGYVPVNRCEIPLFKIGLSPYKVKSSINLEVINRF